MGRRLIIKKYDWRIVEDGNARVALMYAATYEELGVAFMHIYAAPTPDQREILSLMIDAWFPAKAFKTGNERQL